MEEEESLEEALKGVKKEIKFDFGTELLSPETETRVFPPYIQHDGMYYIIAWRKTFIMLYQKIQQQVKRFLEMRNLTEWKSLMAQRSSQQLQFSQVHYIGLQITTVSLVKQRIVEKLAEWFSVSMTGKFNIFKVNEQQFLMYTKSNKNKKLLTHTYTS